MPGFWNIAFTDAVRALQERYGSRLTYARLQRNDSGSVALGEEERAFIESRDSFYLASVSSDGWPYLQHRGGPRGFLHVLDDTHLAFADFRGNRQYISTGNISGNARVALLLMDYPSRSRLKLLAHATVLDPRADHELSARLRPAPTYRGAIERIFVFNIVAWDWNCSQHITPRYTVDELQRAAEESS